MKSSDTENSMAEIISLRTHRKLEIGAKNQTITLLAENIFIKSLQIIGNKFQKEKRYKIKMLKVAWHRKFKLVHKLKSTFCSKKKHGDLAFPLTEV